VGFLFIPNIVLPLFRMSKTEEPWIRVMAILVLIIALFYLISACNNIPVIFWTTIFGKGCVFLSFAMLVIGMFIIFTNRPCLWHS
jgi:hypothetical protein